MIEIRNVKKRFKSNNVLDMNENVKLLKGINSLVGLNGSGKTTLLKLLIGVIKPDHGEILYNGKKIVNDLDSIGVLFDKTIFHHDLSGIDNLKYFNSILSNKCSELELLDLVKEWDIPEDKTPVKNYSLGMKKKLSIAISLLKKPLFWFLDEPFNGLDEKTQKKLIDKIKSMREDGKIILLISHDMKDNIELADHILLLREKRLHYIYQFKNLYTKISNVNIVISDKETIPKSILDISIDIKYENDKYQEIIIPSKFKKFAIEKLSLEKIEIEKITKEEFTLDYIHKLTEMEV